MARAEELEVLDVVVRMREELVLLSGELGMNVVEVVGDAVDRVLAAPVDLLEVGPGVERVAADGAGGREKFHCFETDRIRLLLEGEIASQEIPTLPFSQELWEAYIQEISRDLRP